MIYYAQFIKDSIGNNYIGIEISQNVVQPFLDQMKTLLSDKDFDEYTKNQQTRDNGKYQMILIKVMDFNRL